MRDGAAAGRGRAGRRGTNDGMAGGTRSQAGDRESDAPQRAAADGKATGWLTYEAQLSGLCQGQKQGSQDGDKLLRTGLAMKKSSALCWVRAKPWARTAV